LEVKVIVGSGAGDDMWLAYDTAAYPSYLRLPDQTDPDRAGNPVTLTADGGAATGRFRPDPNEGRFVFPLDGYTHLSDSDWAVTYRVRRDGYGFIWFTDASDITPGTPDEWVNLDLSAYLPLGATGAVVEVVNSDKNKLFSAVVRGVEDTREYMASPTAQRLGGKNHRWQVVKVDASRQIQGYVESITKIQLQLIGYTVGTDPEYWTTPPDITPGTTGAWTAVDVSSSVDSDATGVILMIDSVGTDTVFGVRETGGAFNDLAHVISGQGNTVYFVGIDADDRFDMYLADGTVNVYLVAQTKGSVVFYTDDIALTDPPIKSWEPMDADDYGIPDAANGVVLYAQNHDNKAKDIAFRKAGSSDDWEKRVWPAGHIQGLVGIDAANVWEEFIEKDNADVFIAAYTTGPQIEDSDIHADIDVLIRKANGDVRTTIATDVASTPNIAGNIWLTATATFTPAEYAVVDPTDYLEIDLFAHVTRNDGGSATLYFRLDDSTAALTQQTGIGNVALRRE
ncbi:MAG: hypothetical protein V3S18_07605, partial [Dehalococcoidia bacterium]